MDIGDEFVARAREEALRVRRGTAPLPAFSELRTQSNRLFASLPEPPAYRRKGDVTPQRAAAMIEPAVQLLAGVIAVRAAAASKKEALKRGVDPAAKGADRFDFLYSSNQEALLAQLEQAVELHLRALAAMADAKILEGDLLASEASASAKEVMREGSLYRTLTPGGRSRVFDKATGRSRYDPEDEPLIQVQIFCAEAGCRKPISVKLAPTGAFHRFQCPHCGQPFSAVFFRVKAFSLAQMGTFIRYRVSAEPLGASARVYEFNDASQKRLTLAPNDLAALLYTGPGVLAAVANLTTGQAHLIVQKSSCFVATMAFGVGAPELEVFRRFRDRSLSVCAPGRVFVRAYYRWGGSLAALLSKSSVVKAGVRWALTQIHARLVKSERCRRSA